MTRAAAMLILALAASACLAAQPPLALLLGGPVDPSRMRNQPTTLDGGGWEGPCLFTAGGESAFTLCFWLRWHYTGDLSFGGLCAYSTISTAPARATREGGPELPALLEANCPLDASGDWSSSVTIPAGTVTQRGNAVICVNVTADCPATLQVGGATKEVPAGAGMQVFNLEVAAAALPATLAVSVHTDPGAQVELALAINPWIEFKTLGRMFPEPTFGANSPGSVTNEWALYAIRGELAAGGRLTTVESLWHAGGFKVAQTNALETSWTAGVFPADIRVRNFWSRVGGMGGTAPLDRYGIKAWRRRLADDELDRIYNLDRQELQRRGLWNALGQ